MITFFIIGCGVSEQHDVYKMFPLGTPLTIDILKGSEQIVPNGAELILVYNISDRWDYFDPHLLFFNDSMKLYAACYFSSEKIDSLNDNVIVGYLNETRNRRRHWYRNDLPKKYRLNLLSHLNGHGQEGNKLVQKIELDSSGSFAKLYVLLSEKKYIAVGPSHFDTTFLRNFTLQDTLEYPVSEICFDKDENQIFTRKLKNNRLVRDYMLIQDSSINEFYDDMFRLLTE